MEGFCDINHQLGSMIEEIDQRTAICEYDSSTFRIEEHSFDASTPMNVDIDVDYSSESVEVQSRNTSIDSDIHIERESRSTSGIFSSLLFVFLIHLCYGRLLFNTLILSYSSIKLMYFMFVFVFCYVVVRLF